MEWTFKMFSEIMWVEMWNYSEFMIEFQFRWALQLERVFASTEKPDDRSSVDTKAMEYTIIIAIFHIKTFYCNFNP